MSTYNDIRAALGAALEAYQPGINVYDYVPRTLIPPAAIVQPSPSSTSDNLQAMSSSLAEWRFNIMVVIGLVDELAAQEQAGDIISPGSVLTRALNNASLPNGFVQVLKTTLASMMFDGGLYAYADLTVKVLA